MACVTRKKIKSVNDIAEQCLKIALDYILTAKCEIKFQNTLQVVKNERILENKGCFH